MKTFETTLALVGCLLVATAAFSDPGSNWKKYDFCTDPNIQFWYNPDRSWHAYFWLDEPVIIPEGGYIAVRFVVTQYYHGTMSHSSLMGPLAMGDETYYPTIRLNLHYTTSCPTFSVYTPVGGQSDIYPLQIGQWYCVNIIHRGGTAVTELYEWYSDTTHVLIFTDTRQCEWPTIDRFLLGYDYYTGECGSYARWNPDMCTVDLRVDRYTSFMDYSIDCVTVCDLGPTAVEATSWGSIKTLYR